MRGHLAAERARRRSPWRIVIGSRRRRRWWYAALALAFAWGVAYGRALLAVPETPARELIAAADGPTVIVEVRNAVRRWRAERVLLDMLTAQPLMRPWVDSPEWRAVLALLPNPSSSTAPDWDRLMLALGSDAALALYAPIEPGRPRRFVLVAKMHPLARLLSASFLQGKAWRKDGSVAGPRGRAASVRTYSGPDDRQISVVFSGRLGVLSNDLALLRETMVALGSQSGRFLRPARRGREEQVRLARHAAQPENRLGSFYVRWGSQAGESEAYGSLSDAGAAWSAEVWVHRAAVATSVDGVHVARRMASVLPKEGRLFLWHSAAPRAWWIENVLRPLRLGWTGMDAAFDTADEALPLAVHVGPPAGRPDVLPDVCVLVPVEDVAVLREDLRQGRVKVTVGGWEATAAAAGGVPDAVDRVQVRFGALAQYTAGVASVGPYLIVGSTPRAAERVARARARGEPTGAASDLLQIRAQPSVLMRDAQVLAQVAALAAQWGGDVKALERVRAVSPHIPLLGFVRDLTMDGQTTPTGFRLTARVRLERPDTPARKARP